MRQTAGRNHSLSVSEFYNEHTENLKKPVVGGGRLVYGWYGEKPPTEIDDSTTAAWIEYNTTIAGST